MRLKRCKDQDKVFMLDLDNTLIESSKITYPIIEKRMREYLIKNEYSTTHDVDCLLEKARKKGRGVTVVGLRGLVNLDATDFLRYSHSGLQLRERVSAHSRLKTLLKTARGNCVIASDGPYDYCAEVIDALGISRWIVNIISIDRMNFIPKADARYWRQLNLMFGIKAPKCTLFDDRWDCVLNAIRSGANGHRISRPMSIPLLR
jgi:FMN phosphatase YigB (HAD superfamily)